MVDRYEMEANPARLAQELASHIRTAVRPILGAFDSGLVTGTASSGDATFGIDVVAEAAVVEFIESNKLNVAYYTEDAGIRSFGDPRHVLVIDPVDGSRGAKAGFECCVVSVAVADPVGEPEMRNVTAACVHEIKDDRAFVARRGGGATILENGLPGQPRLSEISEIDCCGWTCEFAGRPAELVASVLGEAINKTSIRGGFFVLNSTAYSLTRLVSGQLAAVVDVGGRILHELPESREAYLRAGHGSVIGLFPYDFAAAVLIAQEAGCLVTDAYGMPLDAVRLLDSSEANIQSVLAAANGPLHSRFHEAIERGFERLGTRPPV